MRRNTPMTRLRSRKRTIASIAHVKVPSPMVTNAVGAEAKSVSDMRISEIRQEMDEGVKVLSARIQDELERAFPELRNYGRQHDVKRLSEFLAVLFIVGIRS